MKKRYDFSKMKEVKSPFKGKKSVGINLNHEVIDYFKQLSKEMGIPYQQLINLPLQKNLWVIRGGSGSFPRL